MTPRDKIQEAGDIAAMKVSDALSEFVQVTGLFPQMEVTWLEHQTMMDRNPRHSVDEVTIHVIQKATS